MYSCIRIYRVDGLGVNKGVVKDKRACSAYSQTSLNHTHLFLYDFWGIGYQRERFYMK